MEPNTPRPSTPLVIVTQALLGALFLVGIGAIALLPGFAASAAVALPEYADLRAPLLGLAIALALLALVALVSVALLIRRIHRATILTRTSLLRVDVLTATFAGAIAVFITGFVVISNGQAGSPLLALILTTATLATIVLECITLVLRSLLRHAILLRTELDEVV